MRRDRFCRVSTLVRDPSDMTCTPNCFDAQIIPRVMWQIRTENGGAVFATSARLRLPLLQQLANGSAHRVGLWGFALAGLEQRAAGGHQKADQRSAAAGIAATARTRARRAAALFPDEQQLFE